jgi:hypothetical protein
MNFPAECIGVRLAQIVSENQQHIGRLFGCVATPAAGLASESPAANAGLIPATAHAVSNVYIFVS